MCGSGIILTAAVIFVNGQDPTPNPTPTPIRGRPETGIEATRRLDREHDRIAQQLYSNLYGQDSYANSSRFNRDWRAKMVLLYRKPDKTETEILMPDQEYQQQYAELLKEKKRGNY